MLKISVIVPIYNVEKYLEKCLQSIVNQTYKNLEIILVDDESPDSCPQICEKWALKDNRIKVIHKKNEGLGMARNTGIENATGDYICFIDSDDMLELDAIEKCCNKLNNMENFDIVYFGYKQIDEKDNIIKEIIPTPSKNEYYNEEIVNEFLPHILIELPEDKNKFNMNFSSCMCLINLNIIKKINWKFVSERKIISEDVYSLLKLFKHIKSVAIVTQPFYSYRINNTSLTHSYRSDRFDKIKYFYSQILEMNEYSCLIKYFDYLLLSYTIAAIKMIVKSDLKYTDKLKEIQNIVKDEKFIDIVNKNIKYESKLRKVYFIFVKLKFVNIVYFLTWLQNKRRIR